MLTNLKYKKEIFCYYGIFDREDYIKEKIRSSLMHFSDISYPSFDDYKEFKHIFDYFGSKCNRKNSFTSFEEWAFLDDYFFLFENNFFRCFRNEINDEIDSKKDEINDEEVEYCKSILEISRLYGIKDAILEYIAENRNNARDLVDMIKKIKLRDIEQLKIHCSIYFFLITENYLKSEVFKKDLKEASELNKEIYIILLEELDFENNLLHKFEIIDHTDTDIFSESHRNFETKIEAKLNTKKVNL